MGKRFDDIFAELAKIKLTNPPTGTLLPDASKGHVTEVAGEKSLKGRSRRDAARSRRRLVRRYQRLGPARRTSRSAW